MTDRPDRPDRPDRRTPVANAPRILTIAHTTQGAAMARKLPYPLAEGKPSLLLRAHWHDCDALVVFLALGALVRLISPLMSNKHDDPAVICVDSNGRYVIPVTGGHSRGSNRLAGEIADLLGAAPVITTASERSRIDTASAGHVQARTNDTGKKIFVVGVGLSSSCEPTHLIELVERALSGSGLSRQSIDSIATIDTRANHPAVRSMDLPIRSYPADTLSLIDVPNPSEIVRNAVGTPSVAEAAALAASGPGASLLVEKMISNEATVAITKRVRPRGSLSIVGIGPGNPEHRTPAATAAIRDAEMVIGYSAYVDMCSSILSPYQVIERSPIGAEMLRAKMAIQSAAGGMRVALVCSGDPGVYAMASPVFEELHAMSGDPWIQDMDIAVLPGVTAAQAAASLLGAPLGHDHAYISLSDLLTPWDAIETRLRAAASAGMPIAIYNPTSSRRRTQLELARSILLEILPPETPVGVVDNAMRPAQELKLVSLENLDTENCTMTTCLLIGSRDTRLSMSKMYAPRGYAPRGYAPRGYAPR